MGKIETLACLLKKDLAAGCFQIGDRFPSEYELARRYQVNNKTANLASSLLVAEGFLMRGKRGEGTFVRQTRVFPELHLGFIGGLKHPFYCDVLEGFQAAALDAGHLVSIISPQLENLGGIVQKLNSSKLDGFVCTGFGMIENLTKPVIYLENKLGALPLPDYVSCDSACGSRMMTEALLKNGHRDVVVFAAAESNQERIDTTVECLKKAGVDRLEDRVFRIGRCDAAFHSAKLLRKAFQLFPSLSAIITASDDIANQIILNLEEMKISWRGNLTVTGFGNVRNISDRYPIATIDQHPAVLGAEALEALVRKIRTGASQQVLIEPELVNASFIFPPPTQPRKMRS